MFREFCGASTYENVALVTNMWETIDKSDGERREHELATEESFFAPMIQGGARLMRHNNTLETAQDILLHLLSKQPRPFAVVEDIVDGNLSFGDTGAGNIIKKGSHTETVTQTEVFTHTAVATHTVVHTSPPGPTRRCTKVNVLGIVKWSRCK
ncbi:hypothetical protein FRC14_000395 [Serendipita sp. 396]|nr:hypothetical protein FRC14_000395 [Serendipita sp. 396]KAG8775681.1 hypothetical protein FRC15_000388 [Serendipita sp. 397]KAG8791623.1 hypothetical protein FRC16_000348 [Serendipita sp. 398]KAG8828127.1 hypothetical protein FRC19_009211 [Serendipita sp. 401]KAG8836066.1 hypothetical protein FRC18_011889 [Serendipita sp. 400]KAG8846789.1 hypothetical protein FRB91_000468 [Serendipita sp. 411]KAG8856864.1 hypothetical protein FRC20_000390 [Serendipita sp. 405]KAG9058432.1 hypothetical prot